MSARVAKVRKSRRQFGEATSRAVKSARMSRPKTESSASITGEGGTKEVAMTKAIVTRSKASTP